MYVSYILYQYVYYILILILNGGFQRSLIFKMFSLGMMISNQDIFSGVTTRTAQAFVMFEPEIRFQGTDSVGNVIL